MQITLFQVVTNYSISDLRKCFSFLVLSSHILTVLVQREEHREEARSAYAASSCTPMDALTKLIDKTILIPTISVLISIYHNESIILADDIDLAHTHNQTTAPNHHTDSIYMIHEAFAQTRDRRRLRMHMVGLRLRVYRWTREGARFTR